MKPQNMSAEQMLKNMKCPGCGRFNTLYVSMSAENPVFEKVPDASVAGHQAKFVMRSRARIFLQCYKCDFKEEGKPT